MIVFTNAVVNPRAVMVVHIYAFVTNDAMIRPFGSLDLTLRAYEHRMVSIKHLCHVFILIFLQNSWILLIDDYKCYHSYQIYYYIDYYHDQVQEYINGIDFDYIYRD